MLRLALSVAFVVAAVAYAAPKLDSYALNSGEWLGQAKQGTGAQTSNYRSLTLEADRNGHFRVEAVINGRRLDMMADTGATAVALMAEDAARIGIRPRDKDYTIRTQTANGVSMSAPVMLKEIRIGSIRVRNVRALVAQPGALHVNLLGMSFIGALDRFDMKGNTLTLVQ
ncbi:MAG: TIGR02281 family clan AA aspartic protease [Tepidamorphaceae bacterium]